jgi:hypothetical protein
MLSSDSARVLISEWLLYFAAVRLGQAGYGHHVHPA